ncbi:transcriptional repressor LexA [Schaalia sp. ZJ1691]|uniref:transcriptional repressor LexA n=1 Tax=Schaalia sp. ZJ1691 TaxID=2709404 RepID=UPI0013EA86AC|nr:transcriptional repressor LexA [Schaalia sp. ZJ1691]
MAPQTPLSKRQREILAVIHEALEKRAFPPSVREIAERVGLSSPSTVKHHLDILERQGYIQRIAGLPRAIELSALAKAVLVNETNAVSGDSQAGDVAPEHEAERITPKARVVTLDIPAGAVDNDGAPIPLVGRIAAGAPITAQQHIEDVFQLPTRMTGRGDLFMLEVSGESMIDAGILDGDYVVVRSQPDAHEGEIVAAMIDGEATVKVLSRAEGHIWLLPRNTDYAPILGDEATILGKVVTVIRAL